ncbi:hypothetical protein KIN_42830 [Litoreibacter roseus]|uniref:Uncharacterized protein n=1 Tax=Litoreibacter roseus TaxID=2601869 RepID=A0A6N6JNN2_9RHOB|nr:hypothetical protein KIN_42830 [Litoreibacter roseus]
MFHECLQLGMLAPDEGRAVAFLSGLGRFAIGILVEAHGLAPFLRGERGMGFFISGPFAALGGGHLCLCFSEDPRVFRRAEQGRAEPDLRPVGGGTQGAGTEKSGGARGQSLWEAPDFSGGG